VDLALHPDTHDLYFGAAGIATVEGPELFAQQLRIRLRRQLGEWMWRTDEGIPYREEILVRNPDLGVISAHFKSTILGTPKALRLESFDATLNIPSIDIEFVVVTEYGQIEATGEADDAGTLMLAIMLQPQGTIL